MPNTLSIIAIANFSVYHTLTKARKLRFFIIIYYNFLLKVWCESLFYCGNSYYLNLNLFTDTVGRCLTF
jgi:hypothetical protein